MPNDTGAASQPVNSDAKKSENVTVSSGTAMLLQREADAAKIAQSATPIPPVPAKPEPEKPAQSAAPSLEDVKAPAPKQGEEPAKAESDPDEVLSQKLSPEIQEAINRRIGKEAEKTRKAREETERLRVALDTIPKTPQEPLKIDPTPDNPLANVGDINGLLKAQKDAKEAKRWAEAQLDRDDIDKGLVMNGQSYTKGDLRSIVRNAQIMLEDHIPQRAQFLNTRSGAEKIAAETFPWFNDRNSVERQMYDTAFTDSRYAFLATLPDAPLTVAKQVMGEMALRQMVAQKKTGPVKTEPERPKAPNSQAGGSGTTGPSRAPSSDKATQELESAMKEAFGKRGIKGREAQALLARMERIQSTR